MRELNMQESNLCDIQGRLFELALREGYDCKEFVEKFMNSNVAASLDSSYNRMQWAGEEYMLAELDDEVGGLRKAGVVYDNEAMYWMGYLFRFWHYYTGESSKEIMKYHDVETMVMIYPGYHCLSVEMAVDRIKEAYEAEKSG